MGKTINIKARKAVVIGAGGFKSNVQMRMAWDPRLDSDLGAGGTPYVDTTGYGIIAALDVGAGVTDMSFVCEFRVKFGTLTYQLWEPPAKMPSSESPCRSILSQSRLFFGAKMLILAHDQMAGLRANTKAQVLNRNDQGVAEGVRIDDEQIIPHLYAAGECVGGYYGAVRGHGKVGVIGIWGRIAGQNAAKEQSLP
ncbi:MAG: FAD-binding protein [Acidobacteria bacterium]|nr:FAD-binding protein [Acidobacteriota bacterium]